LDLLFEMTFDLEKAILIFLLNLALWKLPNYFMIILMHVRHFERSFRLMLT
jgi:hypothetical protein